MEDSAIVWFRQDLRVHDNEALQDALSKSRWVYPVYVFDERVFLGQSEYGFPKTGRHRARFIHQSVADLRQRLRHLGADLIVRIGRPEEVLFDLARQLKVSWICCNRERTDEEVRVQDALERRLWTIGLEIRYSRGKMLYYTQDLPFPVTHTPETFSHFRKEVERVVQVRPPLPVPDSIPFRIEGLDVGALPGHPAFGAPSEEEEEPRFRGGEQEGLARLEYYLFGSDAIATYKDTRNDMLATDHSSKLSPWLAQGCLSPKMVYARLKAYEAERGGNESTYWLFFELLWRDYFRLMGKKHGNAIFQKGGIKGRPDPLWKEDETLFRRWADGQTGIPLVDANMTELNRTGFMSNRGRQITASFLVRDLEINWQMGAEYFESLLVDYDPCSNWGNWNYLAGVGNDPREDRTFNPLTQARKYDPYGDYVRHWLPALAALPFPLIHIPDRISPQEQEQYGFQPGRDYPEPLVPTARWS
jgi:deoxyribodipyrimidine photo-lyase